MTDKIDVGTDFLFSKFGLCPDYKVVHTEGEWAEFYESSNVSLWGGIPSSTLFPKRVRLHLDTHLIEMDNGMTASARFAVSHENRIIFLQVTPIGEMGRIMETYK